MSVLYLQSKVESLVSMFTTQGPLPLSSFLFFTQSSWMACIYIYSIYIVYIYIFSAHPMTNPRDLEGCCCLNFGINSYLTWSPSWSYVLSHYICHASGKERSPAHWTMKWFTRNTLDAQNHDSQTYAVNISEVSRVSLSFFIHINIYPNWCRDVSINIYL